MDNRDFKLMFADKIIVDGVCYMQVATGSDKEKKITTTTFMNEEQFKNTFNHTYDGKVDMIEINQPYYDMKNLKYKPTKITEVLNTETNKWERVNSLADVNKDDIYRIFELDRITPVLDDMTKEHIMYAIKNPYIADNGRNCVESYTLREVRDYFTEILNNN